MDTVTQRVGVSRLLKPPLDGDAPVSIFWDFENCNVPGDIDPDAIAGNLRSALVDYGLTGPLSVHAYGNLAQLGRRAQVALINSGVDVRDVPPDGKKETTDKRILADLMLLAADFKPPLHIILVSGDEDFTYGLHRLALRCYHIHVALNLGGSLGGHSALHRLTASGRAWQWAALIRGDVAPMPFTETLGVPMFAGGQQARQLARDRVLPPLPSEADDSVLSPASKDESSNAALRSWRASRRAEPLPVPEDIKTRVAAALDDAPLRGITISELQGFLAKKGFTLDYRGLGYKQLLNMMQAMPDVVAVEIPGERNSSKKYYLRPAATPVFAKSVPRHRGAGLSVDVSMEVAREPEPESVELREPPDEEVISREKGGADKEKAEEMVGAEESTSQIASLATEGKRRHGTFAKFLETPLFHRVVTSLSSLFGRKRIR